jgi:hypothetical protein
MLKRGELLDCCDDGQVWNATGHASRLRTVEFGVGTKTEFLPRPKTCCRVTVEVTILYLREFYGTIQRLINTGPITHMG